MKTLSRARLALVARDCTGSLVEISLGQHILISTLNNAGYEGKVIGYDKGSITIDTSSKFNSSKETIELKVIDTITLHNKVS